MLRSPSAFAAAAQSPAHGLRLPFYAGTIPNPPGLMLQCSPSQVLEPKNHGLPSDIGVVEQLGLLRRHRYVHRGSGWGCVYTRTGRSIPSLWSEFRSPTARLRHPNTVTMEIENTAKPRTGQNGIPGEDFRNPGVDPRVLEPKNHGLPSDIGVVEQLGLLRRHRYVHRGSGWGCVYTRTGRSIPSLWSEFRSLTARLRHPNTVTMEIEKHCEATDRAKWNSWRGLPESWGGPQSSSSSDQKKYYAKH
ncbi:hypothetical protein Q8A73_012809 [Channa argus]|nr:hypothetical protein Q8A73_012809 [Channa argus]